MDVFVAELITCYAFSVHLVCCSNAWFAYYASFGCFQEVCHRYATPLITNKPGMVWLFVLPCTRRLLFISREVVVVSNLTVDLVSDPNFWTELIMFVPFSNFKVTQSYSAMYLGILHFGFGPLPSFLPGDWVPTLALMVDSCIYSCGASSASCE